MKLRHLALALFAILGLAGCGESDSATRQNTFTPLTSIEVTRTLATIANQTSTPFRAIGNFSGLFTRDITSEVTWTSLDPAVATVSNLPETAGRVTAAAPGNTAVEASLDGVTGSATMTVSNATIQSLAITPATPEVPQGLRLNLRAAGTFSDGSSQDLTFDAGWSSGAPATATVGNVAGSKGQVAGVAPGSVVITAAFGGQSATVNLTVTAAALQSISVSPVGPTLATLTRFPFTATGRFSNGTTQNITTSATWSSSNPAIATVNAGTGRVTTLVAGTTTISARLDGVAGSSNLLVTGSPLNTITVNPATAEIADSTTLQFSAQGNLSGGGSRDITELVTWNSSLPAVATVSNAGTTEGLATAVTPGTTTVTATFDNISADATLTVTGALISSLAVTPASVTLPDDTSEALTATGTFSNGTTQDLTRDATWSTSAPAVATVDDTAPDKGRVKGESPGTATITAAFGGQSDTSAVTVTSVALNTLAINPLTATIGAGETRDYTATGTFADGTTRNITDDVAWSSSDANVAFVDNDGETEGRVRALSAGTATLRAVFNGVEASLILTVN